MVEDQPGRLLPRSPSLCEYGLTGVDAVSARNVWVLASGNCQDAGGPLLLLHYNGHGWARAPLTGRYGTATGSAPDGSGLWLSISGGAGGKSSFYRYSAGKMTAVRLPIPTRPAMLLNPPATTSGLHPVTYLLATTYTQPYIHPRPTCCATAAEVGRPRLEAPADEAADPVGQPGGDAGE